MLKAIFTIGISLSFSLCPAQIIVSANQYGVTFSSPVEARGNVTFSGCTFYGSGTELTCDPYSEVCVWNCQFIGANPNQYGLQGATGIQANMALRLWVSGSTFWNLKVGIMNDARNIYTDFWVGFNKFWDGNLRYSDGNGGWLNQSGWGVACCVMHTNGWNPPDGSHHCSVEFNTFYNRLGVDEVSDQINLYQSNNVLVLGNSITGAKGQYGIYGMNANGIVTDDPWSDGEPGTPQADQTTYGCVIEGNYLYNASIGLGAGHHNICKANHVVNSGKDVYGNWFPFAFLGIGRPDREGDEWARTNVVDGNKAYSATQEGPNDYNNPAGPMNWVNNKEIQ